MPAVLDDNEDSFTGYSVDEIKDELLLCGIPVQEATDLAPSLVGVPFTVVHGRVYPKE